MCWEGDEDCGCAGRGVRSVCVCWEGSKECGCAGRGVRSVGVLGG